MHPTIDVLLVDDNQADTDLTADLLVQHGFHGQIQAVTDGVEALALLRREGKYSGSISPNLMLLDLNMPRKNGRSVLAELKADPRLKKIPVVVFTTSLAPNDIMQTYELGRIPILRSPAIFRILFQRSRK